MALAAAVAAAGRGVAAAVAAAVAAVLAGLRVGVLLLITHNSFKYCLENSGEPKDETRMS